MDKESIPTNKSEVVAINIKIGIWWPKKSWVVIEYRDMNKYAWFV